MIHSWSLRISTKKEYIMTSWMGGNTLWQLVRQSDALSTLILTILLGLSILCWAIFLFKVVVLRLKLRQLRIAHAELARVRSIDQLLALATVHAGTLPGYYISKVLIFLKVLLEAEERDPLGGLREHEWHMMQQHIEQSIVSVMEHEEAYTSILSTSAAASPLLGLLGTVWGLVHAFMSISEQQSADITTVAPGIAEALITTLAGLLVAIPALVMYNIVQQQIRAVESHMMELADHVSFVIQKMVKR